MVEGSFGYPVIPAGLGLLKVGARRCAAVRLGRGLRVPPGCDTGYHARGAALAARRVLGGGRPGRAAGWGKRAQLVRLQKVPRSPRSLQVAFA